MPHNITANAKHSIIDVKIAITPKYSNCVESIADGLNELLSAEVGTGFIADYALLNTDNPVQVQSNDIPNSGDLFELSPNWNNNTIQFARLLAEINATVDISDKDFASLCESMDLSKTHVLALFERANDAFEAAKVNL